MYATLISNQGRNGVVFHGTQPQINSILGRLRRAVNEYQKLNKKHRSLQPDKEGRREKKRAKGRTQAGMIKINVECSVILASR